MQNRYTAHVAIGCSNLALAKEFYLLLPQCTHTRSYPDRECFSFYGIQLVAHRSDAEQRSREHYPYHFGANLTISRELEEIRQILDDNGLEYRGGSRFDGTVSEHEFVSFQDPFGNFIEFKYYPLSKTGY